MPTSIHRSELQRLLSEGAQLAEVLPKDEYDDEHLPGALHLPLKSLTPAAVAHLGVAHGVVASLAHGVGPMTGAGVLACHWRRSAHGGPIPLAGDTPRRGLLVPLKP